MHVHIIAIDIRIHVDARNNGQYAYRSFQSVEQRYQHRPRALRSFCDSTQIYMKMEGEGYGRHVLSCYLYINK